MSKRSHRQSIFPINAYNWAPLTPGDRMRVTPGQTSRIGRASIDAVLGHPAVGKAGYRLMLHLVKTCFTWNVVSDELNMDAVAKELRVDRHAISRGLQELKKAGVLDYTLGSKASGRVTVVEFTPVPHDLPGNARWDYATSTVQNCAMESPSMVQSCTDADGTQVPSMVQNCAMESDPRYKVVPPPTQHELPSNIPLSHSPSASRGALAAPAEAEQAQPVEAEEVSLPSVCVGDDLDEIIEAEIVADSPASASQTDSPTEPVEKVSLPGEVSGSKETLDARASENAARTPAPTHTDAAPSATLRLVPAIQAPTVPSTDIARQNGAQPVSGRPVAVRARQAVQLMQTVAGITWGERDAADIAKATAAALESKVDPLTIVRAVAALSANPEVHSFKNLPSVIAQVQASPRRKRATTPAEAWVEGLTILKTLTPAEERKEAGRVLVEDAEEFDQRQGLEGRATAIALGMSWKTEDANWSFTMETVKAWLPPLQFFTAAQIIDAIGQAPADFSGTGIASVAKARAARAALMNARQLDIEWEAAKRSGVVQRDQVKASGVYRAWLQRHPLLQPTIAPEVAEKIS